MNPEILEVLFEAGRIDLVRELEWSETTRGQGVRMGDRGPAGACCPICGGVKPGEIQGHFIAEAYDHKADCRLKEMLK